MRFHDFHLSGYEVRRFGAEIVLHLIDDYPPRPAEESHIRFRDVEFYHFVHTGGAIILDIYEIALSEFVDRFAERLAEWDRQHGVARWQSERARYQAALESQSLHVWEIASALCFGGVVLAKAIEDVTHDYHQSPNHAMERTADRRTLHF